MANEALIRLLKKHKIYSTKIDDSAICIRKALNIHKYHQSHIVVYNLINKIQDIINNQPRRFLKRRVRFDKTLYIVLHDGCNTIKEFKIQPDIINANIELEDMLTAIINSEVRRFIYSAS